MITSKTKTRAFCRCDECGKDFSVPMAWIQGKCKRTGNHCSRDCWAKASILRIAKRKRPCAICGKKFIPRKVQVTNGQGRFCSVRCRHEGLSGENNPMFGVRRSSETIEKQRQKIIGKRMGPESKVWKGGITVCNGYKTISTKILGDENHGKNWHRYIYENHHGIKLQPGLIVHHMDGNKLNNDINNLMVMTRSEHARHHHAKTKTA